MFTGFWKGGAGARAGVRKLGGNRIERCLKTG